MKNGIMGLLSVLSVMLFVAGCADKKPVKLSEQAEEADMMTDSTVYGVCGDGTAMHTLQVVTDAGDTLSYLLNNDGKIVSEVQGGLMAGDRVAVVGTMIEGERIAQKVINLTTLLGKWTSIDKSFSIEEGGTIQSFVKAESRPWTTWKILNGQLLLNKDTFSINSLGADSLYLENAVGIFVYKRQK